MSDLILKIALKAADQLCFAGEEHSEISAIIVPAIKEGIRAWAQQEPSEAVIESVATVLQPYAAKLVWKRMLTAALEELNEA